ncbi:hypothetical protein Leryth_015336 [Lithospermum erythrorhizon]|nr:hypothetical protein Leryth_015336 [Lithospermum erythrorhizon]
MSGNGMEMRLQSTHRHGFSKELLTMYLCPLDTVGRQKPRTGNKWNENAMISAAFFTYCNEVKPGFVPALNKIMKFNYDDRY